MGNAFLWKWGCRSFKADRNKLFAINKRQIDNHTLMLYMLYSYMSVVCTYHCTGVFKNVFFFTPGSLQVGRVEDHRMMFTWHLYLLQSYIQAVLYICITDYMMSFTLYTLIRMYILHSVLYTFPKVLAGRICFTITGSSVDYHFLYSRDLDVWLRDDIERRN